MKWSFVIIFKTALSVVLLVFTLCLMSCFNCRLPVFPGAEGYGVDTPAGRGGRIIHVTNLSDDGPGSFRAAVETPGRRIIVFDLSGTIELQSDIRVTEPYVTIAGQTAPSPGIQLRNQTVRVETHDVLMQHLAIRPGDSFVSGHAGSIHALLVSSASYNCVFDHLSFYWGIDECIGVYGHNLTFSNNIVAEGLDEAGHPDGPHSGGMLVMGGRTILPLFATYSPITITEAPGSKKILQSSTRIITLTTAEEPFSTTPRIVSLTAAV